MNKLVLIGNLVRDPELRSTPNGIAVCTFTVAVNRRKQSAEAGQPETDFFRVTAWRQQAENAKRFLAKGKKVAVVGSVQVSTYTANDGTTRASMEVMAEDIEYLSPSGERQAVPGGFVKVENEELPF